MYSQVKEICKDILEYLREFNALFLLFIPMLYFSMYSNAIYFVSAFSILALLYIKPRIYNDSISHILLFFGLSYTFVILCNGTSSGLWRLLTNGISPFVFYLLGKRICDKSKTKNQLITLVLLIVALFPLRLFISTVLDIQSNGLVTLSRKMVDDANFSDSTATSFSVNSCMAMAGFSIAMGMSEGLKSFKSICFIVLNCMAILAMIHLVTRSAILICVVCTVLTIFYVYKNRLRLGLLYFVIMTCIVLYLYYNNYFDPDVLDAYTMRNDETGSTYGGRTNLWSMGIQNVVIHPLGWSDLPLWEGHYAHNIFLDISRMGGIIPLSFIIMCYYKNFSQLYELLKLKCSAISVTMLALNICFFLQNMVEPILEGLPLFFYLNCLVWGIQNQFLKSSKVYE